MANRENSSVEINCGNTAASAPGSATDERVYRYAPGSNRLIAITQAAPVFEAGTNNSNAIFAEPSSKAVVAPKSAAEAEQMLRSAWFYHSTGVQLAQLRWMNNGGAANRRIVYNSAKRPIAVYDNDQLIARYHYSNLAYAASGIS